MKGLTPIAELDKKKVRFVCHQCFHQFLIFAERRFCEREFLRIDVLIYLRCGAMCFASGSIFGKKAKYRSCRGVTTAFLTDIRFAKSTDQISDQVPQVPNKSPKLNEKRYQKILHATLEQIGTSGIRLLIQSFRRHEFMLHYCSKSICFLLK